MPIFSRRRIQSMLDDLSPFLTSEKENDIVKRINSKRVDQSLPAEAELAFTWALAQIGAIEIEPTWCAQERKLDIFTRDFIPGHDTVIDVAAYSDDSVSGRSSMINVANKLKHFTNKIKSGVGPRLYFHFNTRSGYRNGVFFREPCATKDFVPSKSCEDSLRFWIRNGIAAPLRIQDGRIDVVIEYMKTVQRENFNFSSSMYPNVYSINKNPIYTVLKNKADQMRYVKENICRVIFLIDVGSELLRRAVKRDEYDPSGISISASQVITEFLKNCQKYVDFVVVFSPYSDLVPTYCPPRWGARLFCGNHIAIQESKISQIVSILPQPLVSAGRARSLVFHGYFGSEAPGFHLPTKRLFNVEEGTMQVKISAIAIIDLLSGRLSPDTFRYEIGKEEIFTSILNSGKVVASVGLEKGGPHYDDDYLVLTFADDPAAGPLRLRNPPDAPS